MLDRKEKGNESCPLQVMNKKKYFYTTLTGAHRGELYILVNN